MQITIPKEMEQVVRAKALEAGFQSVEEYVLTLVTNGSGNERVTAMTRNEELKRLQELRREVQLMSSDEIVSLVAEGRD